VLGGGFNLWLGDNIAILSIEKRGFKGLLLELFYLLRLRCSGVASTYGWVTILLYCLLKKEHISLFPTGYGPTLSSDTLTTGRYIGKLFVKLVVAPVTAAARFSNYAAATNPNPCVRALLVKHLT
jgi:hypothetical protein